MIAPIRKIHRILAIDDEPDVLVIVRNFLDSEGFEVETADGGETGLASALASPPDLILLDLMMPDPNGMEVFKRLSEEPATADVPVIFLTAVREKTLRHSALALGVEHYLTKPFKAFDLIAKIHQALGSPMN